MAVFLLTLLFYTLIFFTNSEESHGQMRPSSVDSRFFGLDGIGGLFNNIFPGFHLGNQGGPSRNPPGMDYPANSQFYPNAPIQAQGPPISSGQGSSWPVLDDASRFPNLGNSGPQPNQGNIGGYQRYPPQGNGGGYPQYPQGNFGNRPQNPQYPNQGNFGSNPQYPNNVNDGNQFPNSGGDWNNPDSFGPGTGDGDGTLDSLVPPPKQGPWNSDVPNDFAPGGVNMPSDLVPEEPPFQNSNNGNAILGRPVLIPQTTTEAGAIMFPPSSTQSAVQRQCVQDCQTTTEYNPVCGTDNVTYINPGKFVCARNCGINVFVARRGRCPYGGANPRNVLVTSRPMSV